MSHFPDEKKLVLVNILDQLHSYCPELGSYVKSIYTADFDYSVRLSNGRIRLPEELIDDYEKNPASVSKARYQHAAAGFVPDNQPVNDRVKPLAQTDNSAFPISQQHKQRSSGKYVWTILIAIVILSMVYYGYRTNEANKLRDAQLFARFNLGHQVNVEGSNYMVNKLFGGISGFKVTVTNSSAYLVDIVKVKVTYLKASGEVYKDEILYFNHINPHSTATLDAPDSDRGIKVEFARQSISCAALGMN